MLMSSVDLLLVATYRGLRGTQSSLRHPIMLYPALPSSQLTTSCPAVTMLRLGWGKGSAA